MPTEPLTDIVGKLRRATLAEAGLSDAHLLDAYVTRRDEASFECLVWRHGPAVLGACRRLLGNDADAEDAFQATFLVLVRKAASIRPRGAVGAWLYGVACNVARKARADTARRRAKELAAVRPACPEPSDPDVRPMIDHEVHRLPAKYRAPVVLCELEGQPIADAARHLGVPQGTVASRLARGRDLLAKRLARHGLSAVGLAIVPLSAESVAGVLRAVQGTCASANHLADGIVRAMSLTKVKMLTAAVACASVVLIGGVAYRMSAGEKGETPAADPPPKADVRKSDKVVSAPKSLLGRWRVAERGPYQFLEFREQPGAGLLIASNGARTDDWFSWVIDERKDPKTIDISARVLGESIPNQGIYTFEGDRLIIFLGAPLKFQGNPGKHTRPTSFDVDGRNGDRYLVLERDLTAWGPVADGLQFGLRPEKTEYRLGDIVKFTVHARNMSEGAISFRFPALSGLWPNNGRPAIRDADGKDVKPRLAEPRGPIGPQSATEHQLKPGETTELAVVLWTFVGEDDERLRPVDHAVFRPGKYTFRYPDLHGTVKPAWPTGEVTITFREAAADGVSWGPVVEGFQFGIRFDPLDKQTVRLGNSLGLTVLVKCHVAWGIIFDLPEPEFLVQEGIGPLLKDSTGREMKITIPPRESLPKPRYQRFRLSPGERKELFRTEWPVVRDRREGTEPYFAIAAGEYTVRFNSLSDPRKEGFDAKPTGELKFTVQK